MSGFRNMPSPAMVALAMSLLMPFEQRELRQES